MPNEFVIQVLGGFYKPNEIITQDIQAIGDPLDRNFQVTQVYPPYKRTLKPLDHVSGVQMHEALFEAGYCAIALALENRSLPTVPLSIEEFIKQEPRVIFLAENLRYRQMLRANEPTHLSIRIDRFLKIDPYYVARFTLNGYLEGFVDGALHLNA